MKTLKTCKTGCGKMKSGGAVVKKVKKLAKGGTMFGIPQENLGTSGQYGFAKKGGKVGSKTLKPVPSDKVGLAKLPTAVRNAMGFQQKGGVVRKKR